MWRKAAAIITWADQWWRLRITAPKGRLSM